MEVKCQMCGKVFSDKYLTRANQKLSAHMNRKNPCDNPKQYIRTYKPEYIVPDIQNLDLSSILSSLDGICFENIAVHIFMVLNEHNHFSTMPDLYNKHILYKSNGKIIDATSLQFVEHFERLFRCKIVPLLKNSWSNWETYWTTYLQSNVSLILIPNRDIKKTQFFKTLYNGIIGYMSCVDKSQRMKIRNSM
jgi:hypothetical protein